MGGRVVTKIRSRLKPSKVEQLLVTAENRTKVEDFAYNLTEEDNLVVWSSSGGRRRIKCLQSD